MSWDPPMNQKEIMASISFYKNKRPIVSFYIEQHLFIHCLFEFLHYLSPRRCFFIVLSHDLCAYRYDSLTS